MQQRVWHWNNAVDLVTKDL